MKVTVDQVREAVEKFRSEPTLENAFALDRIQEEGSAYGLVDADGNPVNYPDGMWPHQTQWETSPLRQEWLKTGDRGCVNTLLTLEINDNKLLSLLNTVGGLIHRDEPDRVKRTERYAEVMQIIETLRDIMSIQRT